MQKFQTTRLVLRALEKRDAESFLTIFSEPETMRYWSASPIASLEEAHELLKREFEFTDSGAARTWGIALSDTDYVIGKFTLFQFSEQNRRAEVGYVLAHQHWGKGYMSEAMRCILDHAFNELDLHRLEADTDPENEGSLALLEKFGFRREGLFRDRWLLDGAWTDSVMLGLLKDDYKALFSGQGIE